MVKPKKKFSAFKSIKKSEFRKTPPSMYEIGKGAVAPQDMKRVVDKGSERGSKFMSFLKSIPSRVASSIKDSAQKETDFRSRDSQRYNEDRALEIKMKTDRTKEEQDYLESEQARDKRMKGNK